MKIGTLLRASGLAVEIFNHPSTRQLSSMVRKGMERRGIWNVLAGQLPAAAPSPPQTAAVRGARSYGGGQSRAHGASGQHTPRPAPDGLPIRRALSYVTPENVQKAAEWHGILKSLIDKK